MKKNILIIDDEVETSIKYKKWLEEEEDGGFNLTLINDPDLVAEQIFTPEKNQNEFIFSLYQTDNNKPKPEILYGNLAPFFAKTLDRIGMGNREDGNEIRREITLHSFRRFVKTTISDLGYSDYSEWFIGHAGSTYWRKKDNEKAEIFKKIEPYLTFLNVPQLERQGADLQTKIEELQIVNQSLRENDKVKEDALAHLSDQLLVLSERIQQLERKQLI